MKNKIGLVVTTETKLNLDYFNNDNFFIIGVERGALDLIDKKIKIDLAMADFDHVLKEELVLIEQYAKNFLQLNETKDQLDGIVAVEYLNSLGIQKIKFIAKPTKRYDMNLSILDLMNRNNIEIFNDETIIKKLPIRKTVIPFQQSRYISFFTLVDHNLITIKNLKYETNQLECNLFSSQFISNEFLADTDAEIDLKGPAIMIITK